MPKSVVPPAIEEALATIRKVFEQKNADYSDGRSWSSNFEDVAGQTGLTPAAVAEVLIAVKQARLRSLTTTGNTPNHEAVADTYLDRAVYSVIRLALDLDTTKEKP